MLQRGYHSAPDKIIVDELKITCDSVDPIDSSCIIYILKTCGRGLSTPEGFGGCVDPMGSFW